MRKMLLAMVHDVRVVLMKLADRVHNMRTLEYLEHPQSRSASRGRRWTFMRPLRIAWAWPSIKGELEDLSFRYLEPEAYFSLQKEVTDKAPGSQEISRRRAEHDPHEAGGERHSRGTRSPGQGTVFAATAKSYARSAASTRFTICWRFA